jgi:putative transcriptional regulator
MLAERNMTQRQLSKLTGVRPPTVSAICLSTAKHIPITVLEKICVALNCQPGDLMERVEE